MLPVVFVSHGAPSLALDREKGAELGAWASQLPRPRSILVVSAHWEADNPILGATRPIPLIYDFAGFPEALYQVQYPCPGAPELADRVESLLLAAGGWSPGRAERGLDHGVWVPLLHLFPAADIPVLQMALPSRHSHRMLLALGAALAPLRADDVLIMASGSLVHNFAAIRLGGSAPPEPWAEAFEAWLVEKLRSWDLDALVNYKVLAPGARQAVPSPEHFVSLFLAAGAAADAQSEPAVFFPIRGFEFGSLSRTCIQFG